MSSPINITNDDKMSTIIASNTSISMSSTTSPPPVLSPPPSSSQNPSSTSSSSYLSPPLPSIRSISITILVTWGKEKYELKVDEGASVWNLKTLITGLTNVRQERQKVRERERRVCVGEDVMAFDGNIPYASLLYDMQSFNTAIGHNV